MVLGPTNHFALLIAHLGRPALKCAPLIAGDDFPIRAIEHTQADIPLRIQCLENPGSLCLVLEDESRDAPNSG